MNFIQDLSTPARRTPYGDGPTPSPITPESPPTQPLHNVVYHQPQQPTRRTRHGDGPTPSPITSASASAQPTREEEQLQARHSPEVRKSSRVARPTARAIAAPKAIVKLKIRNPALVARRAKGKARESVSVGSPVANVFRSVLPNVAPQQIPGPSDEALWKEIAGLVLAAHSMEVGDIITCQDIIRGAEDDLGLPNNFLYSDPGHLKKCMTMIDNTHVCTPARSV